MYRLSWYEYEYQHGIKKPNAVLLLRPISPEMFSFNMINRNCIIIPDRVISTGLLLLRVKHHAHRNSKSRVYPLLCQDSLPST